MSRASDSVYRFADLSGYSRKDRLLIYLYDLTFSAIIAILGSLARFEVRGTEHLDAVQQAGKLPVFAIWHNRIFLIAYAFRNRGIVVLTSRSFDGEYISRCIQRLGFGAIRGSSSRGGARALVEMIKGMRRGLPMGFTADGPRGPRYEAKPGPVVLASKTGNPVVPLVIEPKRYWAARSWDRTQIPGPLTKALILLGEPIYVDRDASEDEINDKLAEVQRALDKLVEIGRQWREGSSADKKSAVNST